jgi:acylphosphatase
LFNANPATLLFLHFMSVQYQIRVYGRVQGVGFRYAARKQARSLKLKGWVENHPDGSVHLLINGGQDACMKFVAWCRKGSGYSWVERLEIDEMEPGEVSSFSVRY